MQVSATANASQPYLKVRGGRVTSGYNALCKMQGQVPWLGIGLANLLALKGLAMDTNSSSTLKVFEILHYCSDVDAAVEYYHGKLGWPIIWEFKGSMVGIDAGGAYLLTLIAAKFVEGWKEGSAVPSPRLALESKNLQSDSQVLESKGLTALDITGDPASMLSADLEIIEGIELFLWQGTEEAEATKVVEEYKANRQPKAIYGLGECMFFVNDKPATETVFCTQLGFEVTSRHGDDYCGMQLNGGPVVGLYNWSNWWDKPTETAPAAAARLMLESPDIAAEHSRQTEAIANPGMLENNNKGLRWFSIADPDGNIITFWQFNAHSAA